MARNPNNTVAVKSAMNIVACPSSSRIGFIIRFQLSCSRVFSLSTTYLYSPELLRLETQVGEKAAESSAILPGIPWELSCDLYDLSRKIEFQANAWGDAKPVAGG
jgi:hypothetical protein